MKVFIGGARQIHTLNANVSARLNNIICKQFQILVGDASGIDEQVQKFYFDNQYQNVIIYASNGRARHNIGNWEVKSVSVPNNIRVFDFYAAKDLQMAQDADCGFMIWNGKSRGTWNNVINLTRQNKTVVIYLSSDKRFYKLNTLKQAEELQAFVNNAQFHREAQAAEFGYNEQMRFF